MGQTLAKEQAPMWELTLSPDLRTRPRKLRRHYMHRTTLRRRGIDNAMVLLAPCSRWNKPKLVDRGTLKANMRVNILARARDGRLDEMLLLLTMLEV